MVCLSDEESVVATVRDTVGTTKKTQSITLSPSLSICSIFKEIADDFKYLPDSFELVLQNLTSGNTVVLNKYKDKTLGELNISFDRSERNTLMIAPLKNSKCMASVATSDDELLLGASASPTSGELPRNPTDLQSVRSRIKDYQDEQPNTLWNDSCNFVGLVNQAMTCYLNSLLQALYMTPEFRNALYNWEFDGKEEAKSIPFQLQKLFLNLQTSNKSAVETTELTRSFGWDMHEAWQQHDIQELCRVMFDALEHKFKDTKQANLINDLYEGKMLDYVKCLKCGTEKSRDDTFLDIPLPVRPFGSNVAYNSVEEALRAFVQPETLDGNNQYHCETCNKKCDAHKGLKFIKFPYLLTLHLKRFDFDYSTMHRIKLNDKVVFPEVLNLNSFIPSSTCELENEVAEERTMKCDDCSTTDSGSALDEESCQVSDISSTINGQDDNCQDDDEGIDVSSENHQHENEKNRQDLQGPYVYELFSIMIHSGSASGGHYYAYIKDFTKNSWFCFNDQTVTRITEDDIRKTYGGGPVRGYYSGAYSSSTNAYMLMYRQLDKERNCSAMNVDEFPAHIKNLLEQMREKEELDRVERERESDMYKMKVYCWHPHHNQLCDTKLRVTHDTLLSSAVSELHHRLKLDNMIALEDCRLVCYNKSQSCIDCSFEGENLRFSDITEKVKINNIDWFFETKSPGTEFEVYKSGGVNMKVFFIDLNSEEVEGPTNFRINPGETVQELKLRLSKHSYMDVNSIQVAQELFSNGPQYLEDDNAPVMFESNCNGYKLYVTNISEEDKEKEKPFSIAKLNKVIDRFVHIVTIDVILPETDISILESLSIPPLDLNQNLEKIEITSGERLNLRSSPQPSQGASCEGFGDQSNSEDSSLSDSDRTLVGDAPGDCIGLLSSSSNSPAEQQMPSYMYEMFGEPSEEMNWDETPEVSVKLPNYYFKESAINAISMEDGELAKSCRINVDKRTILGRFKKLLEPIVGVSAEYFKIYRQLPLEVEWSRLTDTLGVLKDGDRLLVKLGRVLKKDEYSIKVYHLTPNASETSTFLFESIVAKGQTVGQLKKELIITAKKQHMLNFNCKMCRLRVKNLNNPGQILLDEFKFADNIPIINSSELFLQELGEEEKVTTSEQLCLFVRRWSPSTLTLGPFHEVVLDESTMSELKNRISEESLIPLEHLEVAHVKGTFPCDMNVLEIHNELDWNINVQQLQCWPLQVHFSGSLFFYRDSREELKELTPEQKKEMNQRENTRLGKCSTKSYSPRRERPLKIYLLDSTPNKSEESCGD